MRRTNSGLAAGAGSTATAPQLFQVLSAGNDAGGLPINNLGNPTQYGDALNLNTGYAQMFSSDPTGADFPVTSTILNAVSDGEATFGPFMEGDRVLVAAFGQLHIVSTTSDLRAKVALLQARPVDSLFIAQQVRGAQMSAVGTTLEVSFSLATAFIMPAFNPGDLWSYSIAIAAVAPGNVTTVTLKAGAVVSIADLAT